MFLFNVVSFSSGTTDSIFGPTKNVWGLTHQSETVDKNCEVVKNYEDDFFISGGSSGGSAIAVASGTCVA